MISFRLLLYLDLSIFRSYNLFLGVKEVIEVIAALEVTASLRRMLCWCKTIVKQLTEYRR